MTDMEIIAEAKKYSSIASAVKPPENWMLKVSINRGLLGDLIALAERAEKAEAELAELANRIHRLSDTI